MSKTYRPTIPARWNQLILDCIVASGTPPPMAARILAIVHTCIYDAWAMYDDCARSTRMAGLLRRPADERCADDVDAAIETAISHAAYKALKTFFPPETLKTGPKDVIEERMKGMGQDPNAAEEDPKTPIGLGKMMARVVLDNRSGDGANTWQTLGGAKPYADYTGYLPAVPPLDIPAKGAYEQPVGHLQERWQPLNLLKKDPDKPGRKKYFTQGFLAPHWGLITPFALRHGGEFRPQARPEEYYTVRFRQQCQDLIELSGCLTDERKSIAEYWMNGPGSVTPPGHWHQLAQWVAQRDRHDLHQDVKMFFALGNAVMDAGIACWDAKRAFDYVRPVTAIRQLFKGQKIYAWAWDNPDQDARPMQGEEWYPYQFLDFVTPPFPEFPSGHSTFSAASAEILKRFTGSDYFGHTVEIEPGSSLIEPGKTPCSLVVLQLPTFSYAATQAGMSRLYGGIHFMDGNLQGLAMGAKIADKVWQKAERLWSGTY